MNVKVVCFLYIFSCHLSHPQILQQIYYGTEFTEEH